jgi:hypothetical protein
LAADERIGKIATRALAIFAGCRNPAGFFLFDGWAKPIFWIV